MWAHASYSYENETIADFNLNSCSENPRRVGHLDWILNKDTQNIVKQLFNGLF